MPAAVASLPRQALGWRAVGVVVRLRRRHLDTVLAGGTEPWTSSRLTVRAVQLTSPVSRQRLAASIDALVELAARGCRLSPSVPIHRREVLAERDALSDLAARLRGPAPAGVAGVAAVAELLRQTLSARHPPTGPDAFHDAVVRCSALLEPEWYGG